MNAPTAPTSATAARSPRSVARLASLGLLLTLGLGLATSFGPVVSSAEAQMVKWRDADGKLNFGPNPPRGYDWMDARGTYYNRSTFQGKRLERIADTGSSRVPPVMDADGRPGARAVMTPAVGDTAHKQGLRLRYEQMARDGLGGGGPYGAADAAKGVEAAEAILVRHFGYDPVVEQDPVKLVEEVLADLRPEFPPSEALQEMPAFLMVMGSLLGHTLQRKGLEVNWLGSDADDVPMARVFGTDWDPRADSTVSCDPVGAVAEAYIRGPKTRLVAFRDQILDTLEERGAEVGPPVALDPERPAAGGAPRLSPQ